MFKDEEDIIRLIVVDQESLYREKIRSIVESSSRIVFMGGAASGTSCLSLVRQILPDAILINNDLPDFSGVEIAHEINKIAPDTVIILYSDSPTVDLAKKSINIAKRLIDRPFTLIDIEEVVVEEVDKLREYFRKQQEKLPLAEDGTSPIGFRFGKKLKDQESKKLVFAIPKIVILITSPKGGVGKTSLACNMAIAAAKYGIYRPKVAIVDMNELTYLAIQLGIVKGESLEEALVGYIDKNILMWQYVPDTASFDQLTEYMIQHPKSGIWVVPGVQQPSELETLNEEYVFRVVDILSREFDLVIIDGPPSLLLTTTYASAMRSTRIYVVVTPDLQCVKGVHEAMKIFSHPSINVAKKVNLIINRYDMQYGIGAKELSNLLKIPVAGLVPETPEILKSISSGIPFSIENQKAPYTIAIENILNEVFPIFNPDDLKLSDKKEVNKDQKRGLFGVFKK